MSSQKNLTLFLTLVALGFTGSFLLSLVLPIGNDDFSTLSTIIGAQTVRIILFFASCFCLFGIGPYLIYNFYRIARLEATTTHYIRNRLQVVMFDIENASAATNDPEAVRLLAHAFEACQDMVLDLPERIDREAPSFSAVNVQEK